MSGEAFVPAPLVATAEDRGTFSGAGLLDSVTSLGGELAGGHWLSAGLAATSTVLDTAAMAVDPVGSLLAAGLGFVIDHLEPIKGWFDDLAGNPEGVAANAATWHNVAQDLSSVADQLRDRAHGDLAAMSGVAISAYQLSARSTADLTAGLKKAAEGVASALEVAAAVVGFVHGFVRDVLAEIVGAIISYAAELVCSLGLATPWVIEQASMRVASMSGRVSAKIGELISSCRRLEQLLTALRRVLSEVKGLLGHVRPLEESVPPAHRAPGRPELPEPPPWSWRRPEPVQPGRHAADTWPERWEHLQEKAPELAREEREDFHTYLPYNLRDWTYNNGSEQFRDKLDEREDEAAAKD